MKALLAHKKLLLCVYKSKYSPSPMKSTLLTAFFSILALHVSAQQARVNIQEDPELGSLIKLYSEVNSNTGYYQIQVGFGNSQKAQELKSQVEIDFPDLYSKIHFESPTYRVRLGRFRTKLEAERKFLEVRKKYPDAMLLKPMPNPNS